MDEHTGREVRLGPVRAQPLIMVIEAEPSTREAEVRLFREHGYRVESSGMAHEALESL